MAIDDTCVVETGSEKADANATSKDVTRLAINPFSGERRVMCSARVRVTRNPPSRLPIAMAPATATMTAVIDRPAAAPAAMASAAILGLSFTPRQKLVSADDIQCNVSTASHRLTT